MYSRTHVRISCAILFASQPVPRSGYYVMFLSIRRKRNNKKPISELFLSSLLKKLCHEFKQNLNKILTLIRNCHQIELNKNTGVIAQNITEKKELTSNTQRTQQRLSGQKKVWVGKRDEDWNGLKLWVFEIILA